MKSVKRSKLQSCRSVALAGVARVAGQPQSFLSPQVIIAAEQLYPPFYNCGDDSERRRDERPSSGSLASKDGEAAAH